MLKKTFIILIILFTAIPSASVCQEKPDVQQPTPANAYQAERITIPYKVARRIAKQRRVANRRGNRELKNSNIGNAVNLYRQSITADSNYYKALFNLAYAHGRLGQNDTAIALYSRVIKNSSTPANVRSDAHYNTGNIYLRKAVAARDTGGYDGESLKAAIEQYKAALRLNCNNTHAQHNLSLAKQLLRPDNPNNQNQNQQNQQNQNQDNKDQQQQNQNQQNNNQQQNQQQRQQEQNPQQQRQQNPQQQREAEQMLNAMRNNEQQTMRRIQQARARKEQRNHNNVRIERDW